GGGTAAWTEHDRSGDQRACNQDGHRCSLELHGEAPPRTDSMVRPEYAADGSLCHNRSVTEAPVPLRPHRYPLPSVVVAVVTLLPVRAAVYAPLNTRTLLQAGSNLHQGEQAIDAHRSRLATPPLQAVLRDVPESHKARFDLAYAQLAAGRTAAGLRTLQ